MVPAKHPAVQFAPGVVEVHHGFGPMARKVLVQHVTLANDTLVMVNGSELLAHMSVVAQHPDIRTWQAYLRMSEVNMPHGWW